MDKNIVKNIVKNKAQIINLIWAFYMYKENHFSQKYTISSKGKANLSDFDFGIS